MLQQSLSNDKLFELAKRNYEKLDGLCQKLDENGYWEKPGQVLKMSIQMMLDTYLQAVLVQIARQAEKCGEEEQRFILALTETNPYALQMKTAVSDTVLAATQKIFLSPPILLQLLGVYDYEQKKRTSTLAFDCLLNIILSIIYLNHGKNPQSLKAVEEYYKRTSIFLNAQDVKSIFNQRYLFVKMSNDRLDEGFYEEILVQSGLKDMKRKQEERLEKSRLDLEKKQMEQDELKQAAGQDEQKEAQGRSLKKQRLDEYIEELNSLIGLDEVKREVNSLINLIKVKKMREKYDMPVTPMSYHMVFTGNPGTGKTTVARLVAKIYKELGILSEGNLVETDRAGLVAGYVGQTALKVKEVVEKAIGGILFIDEAYSLSGQDGANDFGGEAVDTLVKLMEDNRDDLVVIVAGYQDEMEKFLHSNPGLISRFNRFIEFKDYTIKELMEILCFFAEKDGIVLTGEAKEEMKKQLSNMPEKRRKNFGNARGIRNLFEKILVRQANRIVTLENPGKEELQEIMAVDVAGVLME